MVKLRFVMEAVAIAVVNVAIMAIAEVVYHELYFIIGHWDMSQTV